MLLPALSALLGPAGRLEEFCRRWKITELSLFGSALRDDFRADSDIDLLACFAPDAEWSLLDHARMEKELKEMLGREVDLVCRTTVEASPNWIRRREILNTGEEIIIAKSGRPVAKLVRVAAEPRTPGRLKGRIRISADFDQPLPEEILATFRGERE
ncbi:MAG TPA: nucleotidyltransferase domain-containing protein [Thermoanaerobaculia bacterium]|jgi:predicted nucleotidyltransferase